MLESPFIQANTNSNMRFRFNEFILDTDQFEIRDQSGPLSVEPQVVELLFLLIENRERMVSKEEINEKVWRKMKNNDG